MTDDDKGKRTAPAESEQPPNKAAKNGEQEPPFTAHYTPIECGGEGDCFYTSTACSLNHTSGRKSVPPQELRPKGKYQASLRTAAAKEMRNNRSKYPIMDTIKEGQTVPTTADNVAKAGTWAESTAILALANASNIDFRIWAFEEFLAEMAFLPNST